MRLLYRSIVLVMLILLFFSFPGTLRAQPTSCDNIVLDPGYDVPVGTTVTVNFYGCDPSIPGELASNYSVSVGGQTIPVQSVSQTQYVAVLDLPAGDYTINIQRSGATVASISLAVGTSGGSTANAGGTAEQVSAGCPNTNYVNTAIGCIPLGDITALSRFFIGWALGIAGGVALLMIGLAGFRIATSQGDPQRLQGGQELLLSAIGGLLMVVLSVYLLRFIGVDLLGIF